MLELKISLFHDGQRVAKLKTSDGTMMESKINSSSLVLALKNLRGCLHAVGYKETLGAFARKQDWQVALSRIAGFARASENPKRYIIGAMKKELEKK